MSEEEKIVKAAAKLLIDAILDVIQSDPHQWSSRPCGTCRTISGLIDKPFGCYEYQRARAALTPEQEKE